MDEDTFRDMLGSGVIPLQADKRVVLNALNKDVKTLEHRRREAQSQDAAVVDPLSTQAVDMVEPLALLSYQRPGVQRGVLRNLRLGKYRIDAQLDLHQKTVERARQEIHQFVVDCVNHNVRFAIVTHGKGEGREQPALLKSCVAYWLPQMDNVLAFHTAQQRHGGYGATYILLRKSEAKKQELREKYGRPEKDDE